MKAGTLLHSVVVIVAVSTWSCEDPAGPGPSDLSYRTTASTYLLDSALAGPTAIETIVFNPLDDTVEITDCGGWQILQRLENGIWDDADPGPWDCAVQYVMVYPLASVNGYREVYWESPLPDGLYRLRLVYYRSGDTQRRSATSNAFWLRKIRSK